MDGLNPDDPGIELLARAMARVRAREILLVCCGDLPGVGAEATRLVLDVREREGSVARAVPVTAGEGEVGGEVEAEARLGPESESEARLGPERVPGSFGHAVVWPRPHLGKDFSRWCLARGALALREGGTLWCAVRKAKGAQSLTDEVGALMGEVDVVGRSRGYRLLRARRGSGFDGDRARAHLLARYVIEDEALPGLVLHSAPGVFSRRELDAGTRVLIEHTRTLEIAPDAVLDLGCGVGPLALWAARQWPHGWVLAIDSNLRAVALAQENAARNGLGERVKVIASDGLPALPDSRVGHWRGEVDLALVNPPTHADVSLLERWARDLGAWLSPRPHARALLVVSRTGRMTEALVKAGARVQEHPYPRYTVLEARWGEMDWTTDRAQPEGRAGVVDV